VSQKMASISNRGPASTRAGEKGGPGTVEFWSETAMGPMEGGGGGPQKANHIWDPSQNEKQKALCPDTGRYVMEDISHQDADP